MTADVFVGGWYRTGDLARFDDDGYLFIVDRKNDMIITGGENIYCPEVEAALTSYEKISEAAVIGVPDELWGEVPRAVVVARPGMGATEKEIIEYGRSRLAGFKCPKSVVFVDALPVSGAGKVLKTVLRQRYGKG